MPLPFSATDLPALLEALMLLCFGLAWPVANLRMLRSGRAEGKGCAFTLIILCGYLAGAAGKLALADVHGPLAEVFWLYLLNAGSVATNLSLQWTYRVRTARPAQSVTRPPHLA
jgi:hypothetical protein